MDREEMIRLVENMMRARQNVALCQQFADDAQVELNDARLKLGAAISEWELWAAENIGSIPRVEIS